MKRVVIIISSPQTRSIGVPLFRKGFPPFFKGWQGGFLGRICAVLIIFHLLMLSIVATSAQAKIGHWQTYDIFDGLHENIVQTIYQDRDGNLWFGGQDGVSRFNSIRFRPFPFGFSVNDICEDEAGALWFATNLGAIRFDSSDARIKQSDFQRFTVEDGLLHEEVTSVLRDKDGQIWLGTAGGLCGYNGKDFQQFTTENGLVDNHVTTLFEDNDGTLWIGTKNGLCRYKRNGGEEFRVFPEVEVRLKLAREVKAIQQDRSGNLWIAYSEDIFEYNPNTGRFKHFGNIPENAIFHTLFIDSEEDLWVGTSVGVVRLKSKDRRNLQQFKHTDGLAEDTVLSILEDKEGNLWFGTFSGVSRFQPRCLRNFSVTEGLVQKGVSYGDVSVTSICEDRKGDLWFGTNFGGLSRYDGREFQNFTERENDGLPSNRINDIAEDSAGNLWIATDKGLCQYDGNRFQIIKETDRVLSVFAGSAGRIWLALSKDGAGYYDGTLHRIMDIESLSIIEDNKGNAWIVHEGGERGVTQYNGESTKEFVKSDGGLLSNYVRTAFADSRGNIWFGTKRGVSKFNGKTFDESYRMQDGLVYNDVRCIMEDRDGHLWFGTHGGGVSRFDGENFQHITTREGLIHNMVNDILQDSAGNIWIATAGGVTRYTPPPKVPPVVMIADVIADKRYKYDGKNLLNIPAHAKRVVFSFYAQSFRSRPGGMLYLYQLNKIGEKPTGQWKKTRGNSIEYRILTSDEKQRRQRRPPAGRPIGAPRRGRPRGEGVFPGEVEDIPFKSGRYIFQVQAVDKDLVYSGHPTTVFFSIAPPSYLTPQYYLPIGVGGLLIILSFAFTAWKFISHRRRAKQLERELHQHLQAELDDAQEMQLSLLPREKLEIEGFDIAGHSIPAQEVGGDFFDYLTLEDGRFGIALADVSGKAMKGAMAAVMTNGMLHAEARRHDSPAAFLTHLSDRLRSRIPKPMFVAFCFAVIDSNTKEMRFANAGCFDPVVRQNGRISPLEVKGNRGPLGTFADIEYQDNQINLQPGDIVLLYSDGIEEAINQNEEAYGYERIENVLRNATSEATAQNVIDQLLADVKKFTRDAEQYDDMTLVVVRAL